MDDSFDVLLSHGSKDEPEAHEIADALQARGIRALLDRWEVSPHRMHHIQLPEGVKVRSIVLLFGNDGIEIWSVPENFGFLHEWLKQGGSLIPVLLADPPGDPFLPSFLRGLAWVDFRDGITEKELGRLERRITGRIPLGEPASRKRRPASDSYKLSPEEVLHLAFHLVVARRAGPDLLLHLDAARLLEAMQNVPLDQPFPRSGLRHVIIWLVKHFPNAHPDPLWQKWMLTTQGKTLEDLAAALSPPPS